MTTFSLVKAKCLQWPWALRAECIAPSKVPLLTLRAEYIGHYFCIDIIFLSSHFFSLSFFLNTYFSLKFCKCSQFAKLLGLQWGIVVWPHPLTTSLCYIWEDKIWKIVLGFRNSKTNIKIPTQFLFLEKKEGWILH